MEEKPAFVCAPWRKRQKTRDKRRTNGQGGRSADKVGVPEENRAIFGIEGKRGGNELIFRGPRPMDFQPTDVGLVHVKKY